MDMNKKDSQELIPVHLLWGLVILVSTFSFFASGCQKKPAPQAQKPEVAVIQVEPRDTPVSVEFVGQTQSSHQVEIRARVNGFLDKRSYAEGSLVKAGQLLFQMDPKPFQTQLKAAQGALEQQQARLKTAQANLKRVRPLTEQKALSQKDLDDAIGQEQAAAAAVESARAGVEQAKLNLGYTTILSPVTGLSSYSRVQDGTYINPQNSLLTYVSQTDPMWVNFSMSENDVLTYQGQAKQGLLRLPHKAQYEVEVILADGSTYPERGRITFADAEYNPQTGTFLVRGNIPNPKSVLRPGQFVRVNLLGAARPNAILIPQVAVLEGAQGHFVWTVDKKGNARIRYVQAGPWHGDQWFIDSGLAKGDIVIVDGFMKLSAGVPVKMVPAKTKQRGEKQGKVAGAKGATP